jgi:CIC family chloride channel protein
MPTRQSVVLIAAGAGGGIAATFNTPIGGTAFAIELILPVMLTVGIAYAVRKRLCNANIFTLKLLRRGHVVPEGLRSALDEAHEARHLMARRFCIIRTEDPASMAAIAPECQERNLVLLVVEQGAVTGLVATWPVGERITVRDLKLLARSDFIVVPEFTRLPELLRAMERAQAGFALVPRTVGSRKIDDLIGVVSDEQIAGVAWSWAELFN